MPANNHVSLLLIRCKHTHQKSSFNLRFPCVWIITVNCSWTTISFTSSQVKGLCPLSPFGSKAWHQRLTFTLQFSYSWREENEVCKMRDGPRIEHSRFRWCKSVWVEFSFTACNIRQLPTLMAANGRERGNGLSLRKSLKYCTLMWRKAKGWGRRQVSFWRDPSFFKEEVKLKL